MRNQMKYLNLKECKTSCPFGTDKIKAKSILITEGYFDTMLLDSYGYETVSVGGAILRPQHVEVLRNRGVKDLTLIFDFDPSSQAGYKGLIQTINNLKNDPINIFVVDPNLMSSNERPDEKVDPDSLIKSYGINSFKRLLEKSEHAFRFIARHHVKDQADSDLSEDQKQEVIIERIVGFDASITSTQKRIGLECYYYDEISNLLGIPLEAIKKLGAEFAVKKRQEEVKVELHTHAENFHKEFVESIAKENVHQAKELISHLSTKLSSFEAPIEKLPTIDHSFDAHQKRILSFRGKEYIGICQKTIPILDRNILGFRGLMLLAGPPNKGKTALTLQWGLDSVCNNDDVSFLLLSLEMSEFDIFTRLHTNLSCMPWDHLMFGSQRVQGQATYTKDEQESLHRAEEVLKKIGHKICVLDAKNTPSTAAEIIQQIELLKKTSGTSRTFVLVDYLQVFDLPKNRQDRVKSDLDSDKERIGLMKEIKEGCPNDAICVISEVNKGSWSSNEAGLGSVMGSARSSYTPDMVFLYRGFTDEELAEKANIQLDVKSKSPNPQLEKFKTKLRSQGFALNKLQIAKGRDGVKTGTIDLKYEFRKNRVTELSNRDLTRYERIQDDYF